MRRFRKPIRVYALRRFARSSDRASGRMTGRILQSFMYYVYFLYLSNGDIYKGSCSNIQLRIKDHEFGKVESTKNYLPVTLLGYECYKLKSDAQRREQFLKTTEGRRLLKQQYRDIINDLERKSGRVVEGAALEKP